MIYTLLCIFVSAYTVLTTIFIAWHIYHYKTLGVEGYAALLNRTLAGNKYLLLVEIASWLFIGCWLALALPWIDSFTFHLFAQFSADGHGIVTYLGEMKGAASYRYFIVVALNILGTKAAINLPEAMAVLRRGRIKLIPLSFLELLWVPAAQIYRYKFQGHPFDGWNYFQISAESRREADLLAEKHFSELFDQKATVMTSYYPV